MVTRHLCALASTALLLGACSGDDTTLTNVTSGKKWYNCEGNTAELFITADFTATTSVPEPMTLGLLGISMLGLFAAFYASLHLLAYALLDMGLELDDIGHDIVKRPFILMGFVAWLLLLPLAATSFNRAIRALGARRWQLLHRLVYLIAIVALCHFIWMRAGKQRFGDPAIYGGLLALLLGWRLRAWLKRRQR